MTWLHSPILAMDTEATDKTPETARIVTIAIGRSVRAGEWTLIEDSLINPGVPIEADATRIHGITDEQAAEGASPVEVLESVREILAQASERGIPVVIHNAPYDLTLLDREMQRHLGHPCPIPPIIDTLVLFRRFDLGTGSRTLEQLAYRNGITFPAHNAAADALAALRLLHILAGTNDLLPLASTDDLQDRQRAWYAGQVLAAHHKRLGNGHIEDAPSTDWPVIRVPLDSAREAG